MLLSFNYYIGNEIYTPGTTSLISEKVINDLKWFRINLELEHYFKVSSRFTTGWSLNGVYSNQPFYENYTSTILSSPAFYPLNDSRMLVIDAFHAFNFGAAGIKTIYHISDRIDLRMEGYVFKPVRELKENDQQKAYLSEINKNVRLAGTFQGIYNSPIGPIGLGLNYYSIPAMKLGVFFHLGYLIFNDRSFD